MSEFTRVLKDNTFLVDPEGFVNEHYKTIRKALRIAAALEKEPSIDMEIDGVEASLLSPIFIDDPKHVNPIFKAMAQQLIKECNDE